MNKNEERQLRKILNELGIGLSGIDIEKLADTVSECSDLAQKCQVTFEELVSILCIIYDIEPLNNEIDIEKTRISMKKILSELLKPKL